MTSIKTYRTGNREITVRHGSEGPRHDPYAYTEYVIRGRPNIPGTLASKMTLHLGIGDWFQVGKGIKHDFGGGSATRLFERFLGCSLRAFERATERARSRCSKCGGRPYEQVDGYPGETFVLCKNGHVIDSDFDISAVE